MKKDRNSQSSDSILQSIPDIDIIDLDGEAIHETREQPALQSEDSGAADMVDTNTGSKFNWHKLLNAHVALLLVFLLLIGSVVFKFYTWGTRIDANDIEHDDSGAYLDVLDQILPAKDSEGNIIRDITQPTIVFFGNNPYANDRDSKDNLVNMIAKETGGTVYNCAISDSYIASQSAPFDPDTHPMDAYCFYWLVYRALIGDNDFYYEQAAQALGENIPVDAEASLDTLLSIDFNTVDVVTIMYDATDYLLGHEMYDDLNFTNIQQFTGNLAAGIELLQSYYPHIRIIVMSPTYAYAVDDQGEYISSDIYTYGWDVLSTYSIKQFQACSDMSVTFVDNLYGTITEDNAREYLTDNLHLNVKGRKKVAERFLYALNYFNNEEE